MIESDGHGVHRRMGNISAIVITAGRVDLEPLIGSLHRQSLAPAEIIVVSPVELPVLPAGVCMLKNTGDSSISAQYNRGAELATGDWLLLLQEDVVLPKLDHIERLWSKIAPDCVAVASPVQVPVPWGQSYWERVYWRRWGSPVCVGITGKCDLVSRQAFFEAGAYDEQHFLTAGEDTDLHLRLARMGWVKSGDDAVLHCHPTHLGGLWGIWKKHFEYAVGFGKNIRLHGLSVARVTYAGSWYHHLCKLTWLGVPLLFWHPVAAGCLCGLLILLSQAQAIMQPSWRWVLLPLFSIGVFSSVTIGTVCGILGVCKNKNPHLHK